jgi:hypothetical protein
MNTHIGMGRKLSLTELCLGLGHALKDKMKKVINGLTRPAVFIFEEEGDVVKKSKPISLPLHKINCARSEIGTIEKITEDPNIFTERLLLAPRFPILM